MDRNFGVNGLFDTGSQNIRARPGYDVSINPTPDFSMLAFPLSTEVIHHFAYAFEGFI